MFACMGFAYGGNWGACISSVWGNVNSWFSYPGPDAWVPYEARLSYPLQSAIGWTIMLPHVFVRSGLMARNLKEQRRMAGIVPILQVIVWTSCMCIGMIGIACFVGLDTTTTEYIIPYLIQNLMGEAAPAFAGVMLVLFVLGALAVGISTADSFLLVAGSLVSRDLINNTFKVRLSERGELNLTRVVVVIAGAVSIVVALFSEALIWTLVQFAIAIVVPLFPALVCGIYWKRATKQAALVSSLAGFVVAVLEYMVWGIGDVWYSTPALVVSAVLMVVVSLLTKNDPEESREFYELLERGEASTYETAEKGEPQGA
jgi:SSS family solute:Na+ symporter